MTLIDTSAWIEFFRPGGAPAIKSLVKDHILNGQAAFTCPVRYELMLGARPNELEDLHETLDVSRRIQVTPDHWDEASQRGAALRTKGLHFPALDLLIATVACSEKIPLLAKDAHFEMIRVNSLPELKLIAPI